MASNTILEQLKEEASESKMVGLMREILAATSERAKWAIESATMKRERVIWTMESACESSMG